MIGDPFQIVAVDPLPQKPGHHSVADGSYRERGLGPETTSEWRFSINWLGFSNVTELSHKTPSGGSRDSNARGGVDSCQQ
jgi:hypothetical protein